MLVLKRKEGQCIHIGDSITVTVLTIDKRQNVVSLGIDAPREVPIHRDDAKERERKKHADPD